ncbi:MAG: iron reductase [Actinomycetota bacterium]|nr:iron reductase [Actinomycetota bacterium]MDQ2959156.1 iron reductase [Actinomycetota bacterium]
MLSWYLARGAGIAAFASLSVATGAGALTARRAAAVEARVITQYVHRAAALAGLLLLGLHVLLLVTDSYARVGAIGALVLFGSGYRPAPVSLGVTAMYLLLAVAASGLLRARFARSASAVRRWRAIHLASYAAWVLAAWHFLAAGTDSGQWWARLVLFAGLAVVAGGVTVRLTDRQPPVRRHAPVAVGARR